jgi:hypothetical protein
MQIEQTTQQLKILLQDLPNLTKSCEQFCKSAVDITSKRSITQKTLDQHAKLMDLLEIPELMDTFVRSEFYDEALQLDSFTQNLKVRFPDIKIIQSIVGIRNLVRHLISR